MAHCAIGYSREPGIHGIDVFKANGGAAFGKTDAHIKRLPIAEVQTVRIETESEADGRWIAEVPDLPGVMVYGKSRNEAIAEVEALALRIIAERLDHGEQIPELHQLFAVAS